LTRTPLLFLDFDGVLHRNLPRPDEVFGRLPLLADTLQGHKVDIVVSSSYRFHHPWQDILKMLAPLRDRVVGRTGDAIAGRYARWREIQTYVIEHHVANYRVLDDAEFEFPRPCGPLILCNGAIGFDDSTAASVRDWLKA